MNKEMELDNGGHCRGQQIFITQQEVQRRKTKKYQRINKEDQVNDMLFYVFEIHNCRGEQRLS